MFIIIVYLTASARGVLETRVPILQHQASQSLKPCSKSSVCSLQGFIGVMFFFFSSSHIDDSVYLARIFREKDAVPQIQWILPQRGHSFAHFFS